MAGLLSKERIIAPPGFNRWRVPPASVLIHLCIGSVYAWSIYNLPLQKVFGVVTSAANDWTLGQTNATFTWAIVFLGLSAAFGGKWLERAGPRKVGVTAACCWGGGIIIGALGIVWHQLWLLYLGYGVIGGCGLGLGYVSPVSTLIRWFPDRRGMATGMAIMGFGGGAMLAAPLKEFFISHFYRAPEFLGSPDTLNLVTKEGVRYIADAAGNLTKVVIVGANDIAGMIVKGSEGVYLAGTGNVGAAATFFTLGIIYFVVMMIAAFMYRIPPQGWKPAGWNPENADAKRNKMITTNNVHIDRVLKTPQFYLLWIVLCFNVTAGIGVLGVAKTMMTDIFGSALPAIVTASFAAAFVMMISVFNMLGRFLWSSASDYLGRKNTYYIFFMLGTILYLSIPLWSYEVSISPSVIWLFCFYLTAMIIFSMYGGGFATIPAYLADIFGTKYVGAIHGRLLTAWSTAGVLGPLAITSLRERARLNAIREITAKIDPGIFKAKFGAAIEQLNKLVEGKTVTIPKLMEIAPTGTIDPTSTLYNSTMYLMAALLVVALIANFLVKPVKEHHLLAEE